MKRFKKEKNCSKQTPRLSAFTPTSHFSLSRFPPNPLSSVAAAAALNRELPFPDKHRELQVPPNSAKKKKKMMHMSIYWGKNVTLLFNSWTTHSWTSYAFALLACFLVSVLYQSIEDQRLRFRSYSSNDPSLPSIGTPLLFRLGQGRSRSENPARFTSAVFFGISSTIGYLLMLSIMSFNGGVFVAIVLGLAVGYYLFRCGDDGVMPPPPVDVENTCACS